MQCFFFKFAYFVVVLFKVIQVSKHLFWIFFILLHESSGWNVNSFVVLDLSSSCFTLQYTLGQMNAHIHRHMQTQASNIRLTTKTGKARLSLVHATTIQCIHTHSGPGNSSYCFLCSGCIIFVLVVVAAAAAVIENMFKQQK